jgi:hypothetical protein
MASIKRRGKSWRARYRAPDGRERSRQFATKADAEAWLSTHKADVARGHWVDPRLGRMSFGGWVPRWERTTVDLRPTTRALNRCSP